MPADFLSHPVGMLQGMQNVRMNNVRTEETIEAMLEAAGFDFAVVSRCPEPSCDLCEQAELSAAA